MLLGNQTNLSLDESKWHMDGVNKSIDKVDEMNRLGRDNSNSYNYTEGKVEFALQFDPVFQDTLADSFIENIQSSIQESKDQ